MKDLMWFGCPKCKHKPTRNEKSSNDNWSVFKCGDCPKCGEKMKINFENIGG